MSADHLNESDIAGFLDGDCSRSEMSRIETHLEECAQCRRAIVDVKRIASEFNTVNKPSAVPPAYVRRSTIHAKRLWLVTATALAASLALVILNSDNKSASVISSPVRTGDPIELSSRPMLEVNGPADDAEVSADSILFRWRSRNATLYRVHIQDETGNPVLTRETPDTYLALAVTAPLATGHRYFWRVDAISDGVAASSTVRKFRVVR